MIITGTNHFVSKEKALQYYADYGFGMNDVNRKIADKEIRIGGIPACKLNEQVILIDNRTRYAIVSDNK